MKLRNTLITSLGLMALIMAAVLTSGCSSDSGDITGSNGSSAMTYDDIAVSLDRVTVKYDCDYDPVGVTQPGDFRYYLNVDTLSDDGKTWLAVSKNKESSAEIDNGSYKTVSGQSATFRFQRSAEHKFRVRMSIREDDGASDDFKSTKNIEHVYAATSGQFYPPKGSNYSSWNPDTKVGSSNWNVNKRDRSWVLGVLTKEGCNVTLNYSVSVR